MNELSLVKERLKRIFKFQICHVNADRLAPRIRQEMNRSKVRIFDVELIHVREVLVFSRGREDISGTPQRSDPIF